MFSPAWQWEMKRVGGIFSVTFVYLIYLGIFFCPCQLQHYTTISHKMYSKVKLIMCIINVINFYRDVHFEQYLETLS